MKVKVRLVPIVAIALLAILTLVTRYYALGPETGDIDEATFTIVAQSVLRGALPYELALDNKPAGFFYILSGVMGLFGQSNTVVRVFGSAMIFAAAIALLDVCRRYVSLGLATTLAALFIVAQASDIGNSTKSETIANLFVMLSLLVLLRWPGSNRASFTAGVLVSAGVLCRSNLSYLALGLALLHLAGLFWPAKLRLRRTGVVALGLGGLLPLALLILPYALGDELHLLWVGAVEVAFSQASASGGGFVGRMIMLPHSFVRILPGAAGALLVVAGIGIWQLRRTLLQRPELSRDAWLVGFYVVAIETSIIMSGTFYNHYMLQILGPLLVLAAIGLAGVDWSWRRWSVRFAMLGIVGSVLWFAPQGLFLAWQQVRGEVPRPIEAAAAVIRPELRPEDRIWATGWTHLILVYLDKDPILPVAAFPSNLTKAVIVAPLIRAGLMPEDGAHAAFSLLPRYITNDRAGAPRQLDDADAVEFDRRYRLIHSGEGVFVYRLLDEGGAT